MNNEIIFAIRYAGVSGNGSPFFENFAPSGTKDVFCTLPASKAVYLDADGVPIGAASAGFAVAMAIAL
jgi:hypothetical protein